jgi:hypothetical protein
MHANISSAEGPRKSESSSLALAILIKWSVLGGVHPCRDEGRSAMGAWSLKKVQQHDGTDGRSEEAPDREEPGGIDSGSGKTQIDRPLMPIMLA